MIFVFIQHISLLLDGFVLLGFSQSLQMHRVLKKKFIVLCCWYRWLYYFFL